MGLVALAFVFLPRELLYFFHSEHADAASQARMLELGVELLRFVAVYSCSTPWPWCIWAPSRERATSCL